MPAKSQAEVEKLVRDKIELIRVGELSAFTAFEGPTDQWIAELGKHSLLLNPFYQRWLYYDYVHDTWEDAGLGMDEGIFVVLENQMGIKKLPLSPVGGSEQNYPLEGWYLYLQNEQLGGPLREAGLKELLNSGQLPADTLVYSAAMTQWQRADLIGLTAAPLASPPPPVFTSAVPQQPALSGPFAEAAARYTNLKADLDRGTLSTGAFREAVYNLRFQDEIGAWWQINEDGKSWLKWNGNAWITTKQYY